ncbi:thiamine-monophosphate kinase [Stenotrophomonas terrae]|uniref:Thiamine-monophosphate kinase n=1 Tax=Stenotrophomonas terrae TaxID=405446 RepID=A0A0R0CU67_9GAMM|nr:thiamine-phosphate kinase [Stenotrophomonas terrae]KRG69454.1 thiamine-monophosphate kinase [Stenotrophomonas terrae]
MSLDEFGLIERIRRRTGARADIVLGIGDDAALLQPAPGQQLVVTTDTLNIGVHFPAETPAADIGWKALAVNLSDLAAMGATPAWCSLSLSLPDASAQWVDEFAQGFFALADLHGIALIGGDTTRGPLSISITAMGQVAAGQALRRDGAQPGDDIWVSGVPGEAGLALALWQQKVLDVSRVADDSAHEHLRLRLARPTPRVELGRALRGVATAAVDVSDGLLADLGHICARSGVAADVLENALPASAAAQQCALSAAFNALRASAGDDYELCFTAPQAQRQALHETMASVAVPLTRIGYIRAGTGLQVINQEGGVVVLSKQGYNHFAGIGK